MFNRDTALLFLRQLVEIEYLTWAFAENSDETLLYGALTSRSVSNSSDLSGCETAPAANSETTSTRLIVIMAATSSRRCIFTYNESVIKL